VDTFATRGFNFRMRKYAAPCGPRLTGHISDVDYIELVTDSEISFPFSRKLHNSCRVAI